MDSINFDAYRYIEAQDSEHIEPQKPVEMPSQINAEEAQVAHEKVTEPFPSAPNALKRRRYRKTAVHSTSTDVPAPLPSQTSQELLDSFLVADWLQRHDLLKYLDGFTANDITTPGALVSLPPSCYSKVLGMRSLKDKKRLETAIQEMHDAIAKHGHTVPNNANSHVSAQSGTAQSQVDQISTQNRILTGIYSSQCITHHRFAVQTSNNATQFTQKSRRTKLQKPPTIFYFSITTLFDSKPSEHHQQAKTIASPPFWSQVIRHNADMAQHSNGTQCAEWKFAGVHANRHAPPPLWGIATKLDEFDAIPEAFLEKPQSTLKAEVEFSLYELWKSTRSALSDSMQRMCEGVQQAICSFERDKETILAKHEKHCEELRKNLQLRMSPDECAVIHWEQAYPKHCDVSVRVVTRSGEGSVCRTESVITKNCAQSRSFDNVLINAADILPKELYEGNRLRRQVFPVCAIEIQDIAGKECEIHRKEVKSECPNVNGKEIVSSVHVYATSIKEENSEWIETETIQHAVYNGDATPIAIQASKPAQIQENADSGTSPSIEFPDQLFPNDAEKPLDFTNIEKSNEIIGPTASTVFDTSESMPVPDYDVPVPFDPIIVDSTHVGTSPSYEPDMAFPTQEQDDIDLNAFATIGLSQHLGVLGTARDVERQLVDASTNLPAELRSLQSIVPAEQSKKTSREDSQMKRSFTPDKVLVRDEFTIGSGASPLQNGVSTSLSVSKFPVTDESPTNPRYSETPLTGIFHGGCSGEKNPPEPMISERKNALQGLSSDQSLSPFYPCIDTPRLSPFIHWTKAMLKCECQKNGLKSGPSHAMRVRLHRLWTRSLGRRKAFREPCEQASSDIDSFVSVSQMSQSTSQDATSLGKSKKPLVTNTKISAEQLMRVATFLLRTRTPREASMLSTMERLLLLEAVTVVEVQLTVRALANEQRAQLRGVSGVTQSEGNDSRSVKESRNNSSASLEVYQKSLEKLSKCSISFVKVWMRSCGITMKGLMPSAGAQDGNQPQSISAEDVT